MYLTEGTFLVTDGRIEPFSDAAFGPAAIIGTATPPRLKIRAAEYFLSLLKKSVRNEATALFHVEALVQAIRSATFMLQKLASRSPDFEKWYERKRIGMREDPLLRRMVELRNASEKTGLQFSLWRCPTIVRFYKDGRREQEVGEPILEFEGYDIPDPLGSFENPIRKIETIIEEAHDLGFIAIPEARKVRLELKLLRECEDGSWEPFDP